MAAESFDGPDELAARLLPTFDRKNTHVDNLQQLLRLIYHASLIPEEGRFPRFRVICSNLTFGHTVEFERPWPVVDTVERLRRLLPAVSDPHTALMVGGDARRGFFANCIVDIWEHSFRGDSATGQWDADDALPDGTLTIRVDGPGHLRACIQPGPVLELKGSKIRELVAFDKVVAPFRDLVVQLSTAMNDSLKAKCVEDVTVDIITREFLTIWSAMMADAINARHGATFIILPDVNCTYAEPKFHAKCGLFEVFKSTSDYVLGLKTEDLRQFWLLHREHVLRVARMIGRLSATDGAVLFDRTLEMYGFGAKIIGATPSLPLHDLASSRLLEDNAFSGMRHRSAAQLVRAVPGAIAFVISQDGDLSALFSDNEKAIRATNVDAWASVSDFL